MRLYHFTSTMHLPLILAAGALTTTESNLSPMRAHAGPDVVWLTSDPDVDAADLGQAGCAVNKAAVRFTVEIPDAEARGWIPWSRRRGIPKRWARTLERGRRPETWYVVERAIPRSEWVAVEVEAENLLGKGAETVPTLDTDGRTVSTCGGAGCGSTGRGSGGAS